MFCKIFMFCLSTQLVFGKPQVNFVVKNDTAVADFMGFHAEVGLRQAFHGGYYFSGRTPDGRYATIGFDGTNPEPNQEDVQNNGAPAKYYDNNGEFIENPRYRRQRPHGSH